MVNLRVKRTVRLPVKKSTLAHAAQLTLDLESAAESADISLVIGDDALLHSLNLKYRGVDAPTDVLSFPENEFDPDTHSLYLGDVVISLPRAEEQAARGGHTLEEEL